MPKVKDDPVRRKIFAATLRRLRKLRGLTQTQLAVAIRTTQPRVSEWEQGLWIPTFDQLWRLHDTLGVSWKKLMGET